MPQFFVNVDRDNRQHLTEDQQRFLCAVVPLSEYIQEQTVIKCEESIPAIYTHSGIFPSVCAGLCIYKSQWGTHPASKDRIKFASGEWVHGNNLALIKADSAYIRLGRPHIPVGNLRYKSFNNWAEFAMSISDRWAWTEDFQDVLRQRTWKDQLKSLAERDEDPNFFDSISNLITLIKLTEFDN